MRLAIVKAWKAHEAILFLNLNFERSLSWVKACLQAYLSVDGGNYLSEDAFSSFGTITPDFQLPFKSATCVAWISSASI